MNDVIEYRTCSLFNLNTFIVQFKHEVFRIIQNKLQGKWKGGHAIKRQFYLEVGLRLKKICACKTSECECIGGGEGDV